jgi:hypothetical protein
MNAAHDTSLWKVQRALAFRLRSAPSAVLVLIGIMALILDSTGAEQALRASTGIHVDQLVDSLQIRSPDHSN